MNQEKQRNHKTFMERYKEDPEFRKKHIDKMTESVRCECGKYVAKGYLSKHKRNKTHLKYIEIMKNNSDSNSTNSRKGTVEIGLDQKLNKVSGINFEEHYEQDEQDEQDEEVTPDLNDFVIELTSLLRKYNITKKNF
jgi:hypothetical protein